MRVGIRGRGRRVPSCEVMFNRRKFGLDGWMGCMVLISLLNVERRSGYLIDCPGNIAWVSLRPLNMESPDQDRALILR